MQSLALCPHNLGIGKVVYQWSQEELIWIGNDEDGVIVMG
jgi:hypothetical protein